MSVNSVVLMGRLVADPSLKATESGTEVCNFTIAVDRRFAKKGEEKQADFINCTAWRQSAVFIDKYFKKGSPIAIQGYIQTRVYEDKNGIKRKAVEVIVDQSSFCGGKNESAPSVPSDSASNLDVNNDDPVEDDDLPF